MARHNRDASGEDQHGRMYQLSYQPDWLHQVKVTRDLQNGRQSTRTLFRNPAPAEQPPGSRVRTRISCLDPRLEFAIEVDDPHGVITRIVVETITPPAQPQEGDLSFSIEARSGRGRGRKGHQKT